ncbi:MAG: T9SS type A sorting domain-containing protein, partial [Saprospiraceae bacterium]
PTPKNKSYHSIGLENTTCWQIFWQDAKTMMGCYSDIGGIRSIDAGKSWGYQYSGFSVNSLYRMVKTTNGNVYGACSNIHDMYQSTRLGDNPLDLNDANGKIVFSTDQGVNWSTLHQFNHPVYWLASDPNNSNTMYASVIHFSGSQGNQLGGIYRCNDLNKGSASAWNKLANPPRTEGHPASISVLNDGKVVCTFSGRRNSSGAFTASSGVFLYDPIANSWQDLSYKDMQYWTKDLIIDPNDPSQNTWFVCVFSGWGGAPNGLGGLYKTTNRGFTWTKLTASVFDRVTSITFNPSKLSQAFLTTETQGLWVSNNMNTMLPDWNLVASYPFRQPERVYFNPYNSNELWISSFGNGMKVANLNITSDFDYTNSNIQKMTLYPNPNQGDLHICFDSKISESLKFVITDIQGKQIYGKEMKINLGLNNIFISLPEHSKGIYYLQLNTENELISKEFMVH